MITQPRRSMSSMVLLLLPCLLASTPAFSSEAPPAEELAEILVSLPEFRKGAITMAAEGQIPPGTASELFQLFMEQDRDVWPVLRSDLASALAEEYDQEALVEMRQSFAQEADKAWRRDREQISALVRELANRRTETSEYLQGVACKAGVLRSPLEAAFAQVRASGDEPKGVTLELVGRLQPFMEPVEAFCACMFDALREKYGEDVAYKQQEMSEEQIAFVTGLAQSGECPNPFAAMEAAGDR